MSLFSICFTYFALLIAFTALCRGLGTALLSATQRCTQENIIARFFFETLAGSALLALIISICYTGGKTIFTGFILLAIFFLIEYRNNKTEKILHEKSAFSNKNFLPLLILLFLSFGWQAFSILQSGDFPIREIERDNYYYGEISRHLTAYGLENTFGAANGVYAEYRSATPYHYFDLWLSGWGARVSGTEPTLFLQLVIWPFLMFLLSAGCLSLIEQFKKLKWFHALPAFLPLFIGGISLAEFMPGWNDYGGQMESVTERYGAKLLPACCFTIAGILLFIRQYKTAGLLCFLCLPIVSISLAPAVLGGILFYSTIMFFVSSAQRRFHLRFITYTVLAATFISLFYFTSESSELNFRLNQPITSYTDLKSFSFFHLKFFLVELLLKIYRQPFIFSLNYFPFLFICICLAYTKKSGAFRHLYLLFATFWLSGSLAFSSFYLMDDSNQFYTNTLALWHSLFAVAAITFIFTDQRLWVKASATIILSAAITCKIYDSWISLRDIESINRSFSASYMERIKSLCDQEKNILTGAVFYDPEFYQNRINTYPMEYFNTPFTGSRNLTAPFNLTPPDLVDSASNHQLVKNLALSPYALYRKKMMTSGMFKDEISTQLGFIRNNKLNFLFFQNALDPELILQLKIKAEIVDEKTRQHFVLLQ